MRINMDLVREILLCVEKNTGLHKSCYFIDEGQMESVCYAMGEELEQVPRYQKEMIGSGKAYDAGTLFYHVKYCADAGLLVAKTGTETYKIIVSDLSVSGHEFIENIRENSRWKAVKEKTRAAGTLALGILIEAAKERARAEIMKYIR